MKREINNLKKSGLRSVLLSYSQPMHGELPHSYQYDFGKKLNVIKDKEGLVLPFVDSRLEELCISTKTEASRETDDCANELLLISKKDVNTNRIR